MKKEVKVPSVGESITSGTVVSWLKHTGDAVQPGDNLFELETDKAVLEIPSPDAGTLETLVEEGTEVQIGQTVATLTADGAAPAATPAEQAPAEQPEPAAVETAPKEPATAEAATTGRGGFQTRPAPERAVPPKVSEASVEGVPSSKRGQDARDTTPPGVTASEPSERVPMTAIRKRTAERLVRAKQTAAYLTTFNEIDMQNVMDIRARHKDQFEKDHGARLGFMSFFVKACCQALKEYPAVNTEVDGNDIIYHRQYHIGVAISIEGGLLVPVIRDADTRHFADIEAAIADMARRAKDKKLMPDELTGGTFSITNGGVFGSLLSTPIPAWPQTAILGMHAVKKRPVVIDDDIAIRPMMFVALTYDHRVIDGREAIGFLAAVKNYIEEPEKMLLEL